MNWTFKLFEDNDHNTLFGLKNLVLIFQSPFRLGVRTSPFQGDNTGSNPVRDIFLNERFLDN